MKVYIFRSNFACSRSLTLVDLGFIYNCLLKKKNIIRKHQAIPLSIIMVSNMFILIIIIYLEIVEIVSHKIQSQTTINKANVFQMFTDKIK